MSWHEILIGITISVVSGLILATILYFVKHLYESYKQRSRLSKPTTKKKGRNRRKVYQGETTNGN